MLIFVKLTKINLTLIVFLVYLAVFEFLEQFMVKKVMPADSFIWIHLQKRPD